MPINNRNYLNTAITATTVVYNPTVTGVQSTLIGLLISNTTSTNVIATVTLTSGTTTASIVTNVTIPVATSLNIIDANRLVVAQNNSISVTSSGRVDVIVSAVEVS
jgi:hypothetical protein